MNDICTAPICSHSTAVSSTSESDIKASGHSCSPHPHSLSLVSSPTPLPPAPRSLLSEPSDLPDMPAPDILTFRLGKDNNKLCYIVPPQSLEVTSSLSQAASYI